MLSISDFSQMCHLSPQTLRYYHSEGLLVPASVDEKTGYRSYTFDQVEKAMLITLLRDTGMSIKLVRHALDEPDTALPLLRQHTDEVQRARHEQDNAIRDAQDFLGAWPEPTLRQTTAMSVVSKLVPANRTDTNEHHWADTRTTAATIREVTEAVEAAGALVSGAPWRSAAIETDEQKRQAITADGPHWLVKVPFTGNPAALAAALPAGMAVQDFPPRDEIAIRLPGQTTLAKYATALSRFTAYPLQNAFIDMSRIREVLHQDHVETAVAICHLDEDDAGLT
jgi:DNA-binding transcriptional MerR regulator